VFQIANTKKVGDLQFYKTDGKPVTLRPGVSRSFEVGHLNEGTLRNLLGQKSGYKVRADSEEAEAMMERALSKPRKPGGSPLVHGSTEPARFDTVLNVRDDFTKHTQPPTGEGQGEGQGSKTQKDLFIREEQTGEAPPQPPATVPELPKEPQKSAAALLIEKAADLPFTEFRAQARELLGDSFPAGNPGRPAIVEALKTLPQEVTPE
jgi:hypothetical protein